MQLRAECEDILNSITAGSIPNGAFEAILEDTMEACILGEAEFEECYAKFKNQVSISLYE